MRVIMLGLAAAAISGGGASAQSGFGDTALAYRDGVVYDDDLVPGRGVDQSYLVDEQGGGDGLGIDDGAARSAPASRGAYAPERRRLNSPNLIGPDGRAVRY